MENHEDKAAEQTLPPRTALTVREVLVAARKLIKKPEDWVSNPYANGWDERNCALTAICEATSKFPEAIERAAIAAVEDAIANELMRFNDTHTHAEVLAAFDKAIAECAA